MFLSCLAEPGAFATIVSGGLTLFTERE